MMEIKRKTIAQDEEYLRQKYKEVSFSNKSYKKDIICLEEFCKHTECFALAAVQIGIPKRMVYLKNTTLDVPLTDKKHNEGKVLINPVIISSKGETKFWEACLSCLDNVGLVSRPYEMVVEYYDAKGNLHTDVFEEFEATVLSHEIDHLDGILHMDIAEKVMELPQDKRMELREREPYIVISKTCPYIKPQVKTR